MQVKPLSYSFYRLFCSCLVIALAGCIFIALRYPTADYRFFQFVRNWKYPVIVTYSAAVVEPKNWVVYYNIMLIILYLHFGKRFTKVVIGILLLLFIAYYVSDWSMYLGLGSAAKFDPTLLSRNDIDKLQNGGQFAYPYVAMVSAMVTYLCFVLHGTHKWYKVLFIVAAAMLPFGCIVMGALLPMRALTASFIGMVTATAISPFYIQKTLLSGPSTS